MSNTNTGGPAFSQCVYNMKGGYDITGGMTLRDYFAAKAMHGFLNEPALKSYEAVAVEAYKQADAMMEARES